MDTRKTTRWPELVGTDFFWGRGIFFLLYLIGLCQIFLFKIRKFSHNYIHTKEEEKKMKVNTYM